MLSRNAANAIFTMETLRTLSIDMKNCPSRNDEFYTTWAEVASSSKVGFRSLARFRFDGNKPGAFREF